MFEIWKWKLPEWSIEAVREIQREGRYYLQGRIEADTLAVLFNAVDRQTREPFVLKLIGGQWMSMATDRMENRIERREVAMLEGMIGSWVNHPHILGTSEYGEFGDCYRIVMEVGKGGTLQELLDRDGPLTPEMAGVALCQYASGLKALWDEGLLHVDTLARNVYLMRKFDGTPESLHVAVGDFNQMMVLEMQGYGAEERAAVAEELGLAQGAAVVDHSKLYELDMLQETARRIETTSPPPWQRKGFGELLRELGDGSMLRGMSAWKRGPGAALVPGIEGYPDLVAKSDELKDLHGYLSEVQSHYVGRRYPRGNDIYRIYGKAAPFQTSIDEWYNGPDERTVVNFLGFCVLQWMNEKEIGGHAWSLRTGNPREEMGIPEDLSIDAQDALWKAVRINREDRWSTVEEFVTAFCEGIGLPAALRELRPSVRVDAVSFADVQRDVEAHFRG